MKTLSLTLLATFIFSFSQAQFLVENSDDPAALVEDFLLGSGVLISNVQYYGEDVQIGSFVGGDGIELGMDMGIVLSTADATNLNGNGQSDIFTNGSSAYAEDLLTVANTVPGLIGQNFEVFDVNDECVLEFDFVPYGEDLSFNFLFGSDEYLEWINSSFNDVFAFFISGPGIDGPYLNGAENIAVVPDSDPALPITVSSVNDIVNTDLYIDNFSNEGIAIDGYTIPMQAQVDGLQVGETYHIALAIADGSDSALESVVLLEEGSFTSTVEVEEGDIYDLNEDGILSIEDLLLLIADYGCVGMDCVGDFNGDGIVNILDVLDFLSQFE